MRLEKLMTNIQKFSKYRNCKINLILYLFPEKRNKKFHKNKNCIIYFRRYPVRITTISGFNI